MFKVLEVKLPADHAEVRQDPKSAHAENHFIGDYSGTAVVPYAYQRLIFGGWSDSTRSVFVANAVGPSNTVVIVLIDRGAGKLLITRDYADGRVTQLTDFPPTMAHDEAIWPDDRTVVRTGREQTFHGQVCHELLLVQKDTMRVWSADEVPSPFAEVLGIMGLLHGQVKQLSDLFFTGPTFPMRYEHKQLQMELLDFHVGPRPMPNYHVGDLGTIENMPMSSSESLLQRWERIERLGGSRRGSQDMGMDMNTDMITDEVPPPPPTQEERTYTVAEVEVVPEFPGGASAFTAYIARTLVYPEMEREVVDKKVYVEFTVGPAGTIRDIKVKRGVSPWLDKEALRVIKSMPNWNPGMLNGRAVEVQMVVPVKFQ